MPKAKKTDKKRWEKQEKRRLRNRSVRSAVKTYISRARQAIAQAPMEEMTTEAVLRAIRELDKAAQKGVIHDNNAARRKSRLVKRLHAALAAAAAGAA
jgi:small subunit ribosomal protein S20